MTGFWNSLSENRIVKSENAFILGQVLNVYLVHTCVIFGAFPIWKFYMNICTIVKLLPYPPTQFPDSERVAVVTGSEATVKNSFL